MIVGDAPHLRVLCDFGGVVERGGAGRKAEHDGAAGFVDGFGDLADLGGPVGVVGDAIDLEEVDAPGRVELEHGIVIGLAGGVVFDAPVAFDPRGRATVVSAASAAWKLVPAMGRLAATTWRGMPRTMWMPNLSPWCVNPIGQRLEAGAVGGGGEAAGYGNQKAIARSSRYLRLLEGLAGGVGHVPAFVDHGVFPSILLEQARTLALALN